MTLSEKQVSYSRRSSLTLRMTRDWNHHHVAAQCGSVRLQTAFIFVELSCRADLAKSSLTVVAFA